MQESLRHAATALATATVSVQEAQDQLSRQLAKDKSFKWSTQALKGSSTEASSEEATTVTSGSSSSQEETEMAGTCADASRTAKKKTVTRKRAITSTHSSQLTSSGDATASRRTSLRSSRSPSKKLNATFADRAAMHQEPLASMAEMKSREAFATSASYPLHVSRSMPPSSQQTTSAFACLRTTPHESESEEERELEGQTSAGPKLSGAAKRHELIKKKLAAQSSKKK
jgi:hypothetical protein